MTIPARSAEKHSPGRYAGLGQSQPPVYSVTLIDTSFSGEISLTLVCRYQPIGIPFNDNLILMATEALAQGPRQAKLEGHNG